MHETKKPIISTLVLDLEKEDLRHRALNQLDKPLSPPVHKQVSILSQPKDEAATPTITVVHGPTNTQETVISDHRTEVDRQNQYIMRELEKMKAENLELRSLILH